MLCCLAMGCAAQRGAACQLFTNKVKNAVYYIKVNVFGHVTKKYNIEYKQNPGKTG